ncbi:MAG: glycosyltransferase, partial [Sphingobacteriaceae bacterium]
VGAMVTAACKQANIPLIIQFHGADAHQQKTVQTYLPFYKKAFAYADAIVTVSQDMLDTLIRLGASKEKIFLNPCGVDTQLFSQIDISQSPPNFLSVGRFVAKKSPQSVVKAFKIVSDQIVNAHLWMVGDGPLFKETKQLAEMLLLQDKITFTGVLASEEIIELMKNMRCFVQHSVTAVDGDMEGTPVTILEAASSGLPIISTKHAGIKQAVIDGKTGFLVDEHNISLMAERMIEIASSTELAVQFGKAARKHMIENYAIENQIDNLDRIIQTSIHK